MLRWWHAGDLVPRREFFFCFSKFKYFFFLLKFPPQKKNFFFLPGRKYEDDDGRLLKFFCFLKFFLF